MRFRRPSAASIIAVTALFFALGGTAVASHFLITSTGQIRPSVLTKLKGRTGPAGPAGPAGLQGATGATGAAGPAGPAGKEGPPGKEGAGGPEGKEGKQGPSGGPPGPEGKEGKEGREGPRGPEGKEGARGPEGKEGKEGPPGTTKLSRLETVRTGPVEFSEQEFIAVAHCPQGKRPVSGGFFKKGPPLADEVNEAFVTEVSPGKFESGWEYGGTNSGASPVTIEAVAYCAGEGEAVEASRISSATRQRVEAVLLEQFRARRRQIAHRARHP